MDVLGVFFRYNDFFGLIQKVTSLLERYGITEETARNAAMGQGLGKKS